MPTEPSENVGTRLLFENDRVRVWDFALAPGESMPRHIHRSDFFFLVTEGGRLRIADPDRPEGFRDVEYHDDQVTFIEVGPEGQIHNTHVNIGEHPYRNFVIELKRG